MKRLEPITARLDAKAIGQRIAKARKSRKWRQRDLARVIGATKSMVGCWECGLRVANRENLVALALVLRRKLDFLVLGRGGRA